MENREIVIVGGGFAGVCAAMGAASVVRRRRATGRVGITLVSSGDALVIRPRLYESDLGGVCVPLSRVLSPVGVRHRRASVENVDLGRRLLTLTGERREELAYDQLTLCTGSRARAAAGCGGAHGVDTFEQASALRRAIAALTAAPGGSFSATVIGAGFTGIELAAELAGTPEPAARSAAPRSGGRVNLIERAAAVAPEFGPTARAVITDALSRLGVQTHTGVSVSQVLPGGVRLDDGALLETDLVIWTGGPTASPLGEQLGVELGPLGRIPVGSHMNTAIEGVWAAGDCAHVTVDDEHFAPMSCQHAIPQGRQAGENAAAALLGGRPGRYRQHLYLTCLDLGAEGALLTRGFDRDEIVATGELGKRFKRFINRSYIYPPAGGEIDALLKLGKGGRSGPLAASVQARALSNDRLRAAVVSRGRDLAATYAAAAEPSRSGTC
jgi:NADH dehydrogenase